MALYSTLASLSQTAASNAADGSVDAPSTIDQQLNLLASFIAQIRDANGFTTGIGYVAQCRLVKSGSNIVLQRFNGTGLTINGAAYAIPSAGVSLAPTGLTPSTLYYIYAYMNSSTMTLEASTTGHSTDSTTGIEIKTGDATRTLVGMVRPITGPAFQDVEDQRFVISWFNRRPIECKGILTVNTTNSGTSYSEINANLRTEFLMWAGDTAPHSFCGFLTNNTASIFAATNYALDGTAIDGNSLVVIGATSSPYPVFCTSNVSTASEGYHYMTLFGRVSSTSTSNYAGSATATDRCVNYGVIQG